jgi:pimeloyl-ACP methyl ester carboxylesterase
MGSVFSSRLGIDSIGSIDDTVTYLLFQAPDTDKVAIRNLAFKRNYTLRDIDGFSTLEIKPLVSKLKKVIIFSHGNASDILGMSYYLEKLSNNLGITTVCYDYAGYGLSEGRPSEEQCYEALKSVVNFYRRTYLENDIILVGQSLGTGVVTHYISTNNWFSPVILISPYKSIPRVLYDTSCAESSFRHNTFSTIYKLDKIKCPVKIFHGKADEVIDCSHGEYIYNNLPIKTLKPTYYEGVGHNDILDVISIDELRGIILFQY